MREDLINRQAAMDALCEACTLASNKSECVFKRLESCMDLNAILNVPATEKTGHWTEKYNETDEPLFRRRWYCSECGEWQTYGRPKYCPMCGARMKGAEA